jgi:cellulose synthase/poly-beta-1,6-N-acetylglucosamine synthase-like glycosyltransferase
MSDGLETTPETPTASVENGVGRQVTVVVPCRGVGELTLRAVRMLRALYPDVRILLLPDPGEAEDEDLNAELLASQTRILGGKRNFAVARCDTPYVAFIDDDAYPDRGWLENALAHFEADPSIGIVGGPNVMDPASTPQEYLSWLACKSYLVSGGSAHEKVRSPTKWVDRLPSCNMVMSRDLFTELGGFSTDVITGEDIELCVKCVNDGRRILFAQDVVVFHKTRSFKGFFLQRYVWGKSTFDVLRKTWPRYISSVLPFLFVSGLVALAVLGAFHPLFWLLLAAVAAVYGGAVLFDSWRIGGSVGERIRLVPYILVGNLVPGIGAVVAFFVGDSIRSYRLYRNDG